MTNLSQVMRILAELRAEIAELKQEIHTLKAERLEKPRKAEKHTTPKESFSQHVKGKISQVLEIIAVYLTEQQLAARWAISIKTLQLWRTQGIGIKFCKLGRSVRYKLTDIEAFEREQERTSTSQTALAGGVACVA